MSSARPPASLAQETLSLAPCVLMPREPGPRRARTSPGPPNVTLAEMPTLQARGAKTQIQRLA